MKFGRILASTTVAFLAVLGIAIVNVPAAHAVNPLTPWRFQYSSVCVNNYLPHSNFPVQTSVSRWAHAADLNVYYGWMIPTWPYYQGCAETYDISQRIDVRYYNDLGATCAEYIVHYGSDGLVNEADVLLNVIAACQDSANERAHYVSQGIGHALGLARHQNGTRSVMSTTTWSVLNVPYPETADFQAIEARYPW